MEKIDVVVPWVDGNDPAWQAEKAGYAPDVPQAGSLDFRYRDWGLMKYWFRCVEKFMPWAGNIFFVTWGHLPPFLNTENPRLRVVRHDEFIPEAWLPTFSSHAIELNLHRIPELSERFVLFNDDTFVIAPTKPADFFRGELPCLEGAERILSAYNYGSTYFHILLNDVTLINRHFRRRKVLKKNPFKWFWPLYGADFIYNLMLLPMNRYSAFKNNHMPCPIRKSTMEAVWAAEGGVLADTCAHKFRDYTDVNQYVMRYWELCSGSFCPIHVRQGMFSLDKTNEHLLRAIRGGRPKLICINDSNKGMDFDAVQRDLIGAFERLTPEKCAFEK